MPNFTAGTSFSDGVTNDVTAAKLNALVADAVPTSSLSLNSTTGTIATFNSTTGTITTGVIPTLTSTTLITTGTGTAAAPAIVPTGDTNTGIFFPAADTIAFSEGGAEAMRINASGNVGIGTASPSSPLHVSGSGVTFVQINGGSAANQGSALKFQKNSTDTLILGVASAILGGGSTSNDSMIYTEGTNNTLFYNNGAERVRIDSSGNVGIGGTPSTLLHLQATSPSLRIQAASGNSGALDFYRTASVNSGQIASESTNALVFSTNGVGNSGLAERLRIDSSGNVGIGVSSPISSFHLKHATPTSKITLEDSSTNRVGQIGGGSDGSGGLLTFSVGNNGGTITERLRISSDGTILFAKDTTAVSTVGYRFDANGESFFSNAASTSAGATLYVYSTGAAAYRFYVGLGGTVNATNTAIAAISDVRLKENIRDIDAGLNEILELKPRTFDWKEGKGANTKNARGFIAQEIEQVFPDLVDEWRDPAPEGEEPYKSVRQDLIPVLVKAIQELKSENDSLKSRIEALEAA